VFVTPSPVEKALQFIHDAFFAALAIESGCTWATTDEDYARARATHTNSRFGSSRM
jgi:predicted nucleic acid-binding protein